MGGVNEVNAIQEECYNLYFMILRTFIAFHLCKLQIMEATNPKSNNPIPVSQ